MDQFEQAAATLKLCDGLAMQRYDGMGPVALLALLGVLLIGFWLGRLSA